MNADPTFLIISFNNVIPFQTPAPWTKEGKQLIRDLGLQIQVSQWRTLNKNGYNQKIEPTILLPSGVHHQDNLKLTPKKLTLNLNLNLNLNLTLNLVVVFILFHFFF